MSDLVPRSIKDRIEKALIEFAKKKTEDLFALGVRSLHLIVIVFGVR